MPRNPEHNPETQRLSEREARELLERAIELERKRADETTIAELRRVAEEASISPAAFEEALQELQSKAVMTAEDHSLAAPAPEPAPTGSRIRRWLRTAAIFGVSMGAGLSVSPFSLQNGEAFTMLLVASGGLALLHRLMKTPREFQRDLLALWAGVGWGWLRGASFFPMPTGIVVSQLLIGWLLSATLGKLIARPKSSTPQDQNAE